MSLNSGQTEGANKVVWIVLAVVVVALAAVGVVVLKGKDANEAAPAVAEAPVTPDAAADASAQAPAADAADGAETAQSETAQDNGELDNVMSGTFNGIEVRPGNPVVARVDGQDITRVDVYRFIQLLPAQIQQLPATQVYPLALEQTISTRVIQNKANAANLENTPEFKEELELYKQQIARNLFVEKAIASQITDTELKKDYDALLKNTPDVEQRKARHILVEDEVKAKEIIAKINGGANFEELAKAESKDPTAAQNAGDLGWFAKSDMVPEFGNAVFAMSKGALSAAPVKTDFGWHVIKLDDVRKQPKPSFEQVKESLAMQKRREILEDLVKNWTKEAKIEVFDINGDPMRNAEGAAPLGMNETAPADAPAVEPAADATPDAAAEPAPAPEAAAPAPASEAAPAPAPAAAE